MWFWVAFITLIIVPDAQTARSNVQTKLVYPNLYSVNSDSYERAIFDGAKNKDSDGFYRHNIHVTGANGNTFEMKYAAKYNEKNAVHNMDEDSNLKLYQCDEEQVVLHYESKEEALRTLSKLTRADDSKSLEKTLLTGRQLWACPRSSSSSQKMLEGIRRVKSAQISPSEPTSVVIETEGGLLTDVFDDLDLSGTATLLNINHKLNVDQHNQQIQQEIAETASPMEESQQNSPYGQSWVDLFASREQQEEETVKSRLVAADKKKKKKKKKKKGGFKKLIQSIVKAFNDFKPGNLLFWTKSMKKASKIFRKAFKKIGKYIPSWEKKGKYKIPNKYNYGFNFKNGKAKNIFVFTRKGGLEKYEGTLKELRKDIKTGEKPPQGSVIYCLQCFAGIHGSKIEYRIKLGGAKLGEVKLVFDTTLSAAFELLTLTRIKKEFDIPIADVPVPVLSVPLGVMTLGFAIGGNVGLGTEFESTFAYYKFIHKTKFRVGSKFQLLPIPKFDKIKKVIPVKRKSIGPVVYTYAKAEFYLRPTIQLIFTDVANVFTAPQPTLVFTIKKPKAGSCAIKLRIDFNCPVFIGFELGLTIKGYDFPTKTKEWSLKLKYPKLKEACISKNQYIKNSDLFGAGKPPRLNMRLEGRGGADETVLDGVLDGEQSGWNPMGVAGVSIFIGVCIYLLASKQLGNGNKLRTGFGEGEAGYGSVQVM